MDTLPARIDSASFTQHQHKLCSARGIPKAYIVDSGRGWGFWIIHDLLLRPSGLLQPTRQVPDLTTLSEPSSRRLTARLNKPTDSYNVSSQPTLIVPGLLHGEPILLDPSSLESTPLWDHRILAGTRYGEHSGSTWRGGEPGVVAVKKVEDSYARVPHDVRKEGMLLRKMDHPNILALLNAYLLPTASDDVPVSTFLLFTPFYPISLSSLLASLLFTPTGMPNFSQVAHSLATQMLDAVTYLHERGIAHCDIAPSNFVLARSGRVVLFDFGISVEQGDEKAGEMHLEIGAEPYRTPELLSPSKDYDSFVLDLWALGATLAEFFTPFIPVDPPSPSSSRSASPLPISQTSSPSFEADATPPPPLPSTPESPLQRKTLFLGTSSDFALIGSIFRILGTPTLQSWPEAAPLRDFAHITFVPHPPTPLISHLPYLEELELREVAEGLLVISARGRRGAREARDGLGELVWWEEGRLGEMLRGVMG